MNFDLLLKGGDVFTGAGKMTADVGIKDGLVVAIGRYLASDRVCPVYDVRHKWVLPGFIETMGAAVSDLEDGATRFLQHSERAATGGVTTLAEVVVPKPWESVEQAIDRRARGLSQSWIDRAFVLRIMAGHVPAADALAAAKTRGLAAVLAQLSPRVDGFGLDDAELYALAIAARDAGVGLAVSLEHPSFAEHMHQKTPRIFKAARADLFGRQSVEGERVAAERACAIALVSGAKMALLGPTTATTLKAIEAARDRGARVQAMPCCHSLLLSTKVYSKRRGRWYRPIPPLRSDRERIALRRMFARSSSALIALGAGAQPFPAIAAWTLEKQPKPQALAGLPWAPAVLVALAAAKIISPRRLVSALAAGPAAFLGLGGERGVINIGSVADIAVWDPAKKKKLGPRNPKTSDDFNPFIGSSALDPPMLVFNRGRLVAENGARAGDRPEGVVAVRMT
ncbi:MAG: amidohydrolase family protein [Deltaproteobacteria bacterium]|nr:amidohydrolase family protein [Deltaproteobacteria bacterium]